MSILSQLVDARVLLALDEADYGRLEAAVSGSMIKDESQRAKLQLEAEKLLTEVEKRTRQAR